MLRLIILSILSCMVFSGYSELHFTYSYDYDDIAGSLRTWDKIKKILIRQNGWNWYADNFVGKAFWCEISLIEDSSRYSMIITTRFSQDVDLCNQLANAVNEMAMNNDTVHVDRFHTDICHLPMNMTVRMVDRQMDDLIGKEQRSSFVRRIREFMLGLGGKGVWYNYFQLSENARCQNLFYNGFTINVNSAFISDPGLLKEYLRECQSKGIVCLIEDSGLYAGWRQIVWTPDKDSLNRKSAAMELLRKYVEKNDSIISRWKPVVGHRHVMDFKFEPVDTKCEKALTNYRKNIQ